MGWGVSVLGEMSNGSTSKLYLQPSQHSCFIHIVLQVILLSTSCMQLLLTCLSSEV